MSASAELFVLVLLCAIAVMPQDAESISVINTHCLLYSITTTAASAVNATVAGTSTLGKTMSVVLCISKCIFIACVICCAAQVMF